MNPISAVLKAVTFPFKALFVTGLCFFVNWIKSPGEWWAQWVAFGMAIALVAVWARALKLVLLAGGVYVVYRWWKNRGRMPGADRRRASAPSPAPAAAPLPASGR